MIMSSSFNSSEKKRSNTNAFSILLGNNNFKKKKFKKNNDNNGKKNIIHQRKYGKCPICSATIPLIALQEHVDNVHFKPTTREIKTEMKETGNKMYKKLPIQQVKNKNNAFNKLMENAKKKRQSEIFYLKFCNSFNDLCQVDDIKNKCVWLEKNDKLYTRLKNESSSHIK